NASINTVKTAIVMTGDNTVASQINFPNGNGKSATLSISPPTSGANPWQGVVLYQDPKLSYRVDNSWGPGATFNADGLVYRPDSLYKGGDRRQYRQQQHQVHQIRDEQLCHERQHRSQHVPIHLFLQRDRPQAVGRCDGAPDSMMMCLVRFPAP